jgi:hypothetical protein
MMQADGKGIALRPEHRKEPGPDTAQPGIKKMAEVVAVAEPRRPASRPRMGRQATTKHATATTST